LAMPYKLACTARRSFRPASPRFVPPPTFRVFQPPTFRRQTLALEPLLQYGDAFTLRLVGQRMTFVFAPSSLVYFFTAPDDELTFAPAVQQVRPTGFHHAVHTSYLLPRYISQQYEPVFIC
jgi:hypothetical protein